MSDNVKKVIIAILLLSIIGLAFYSYNNNKQHVAIEKEMMAEKESLLSDLSKLETQYDEAISKNTMLSSELVEQKITIKNFKDSLKKIKNTNWKLIKFYKNKIKSLNAISDKLVKLNDSLSRVNNSLNLENQDLSMQRDSLSTNLHQQSVYNDTLVKQNLNLAKKVALGEKVKANSFSVTTYRERSGGKYKETDRARRVDVFKTSFVLNENPIAAERDITAYVVIFNPKGELVVDKGVFNATNGDRVHYSDVTIIPYKKAAIASDVLTKIGDAKLEKGLYQIDFYVDNNKVGAIEKSLR